MIYNKYGPGWWLLYLPISLPAPVIDFQNQLKESLVTYDDFKTLSTHLERGRKIMSFSRYNHTGFWPFSSSSLNSWSTWLHVQFCVFSQLLYSGVQMQVNIILQSWIYNGQTLLMSICSQLSKSFTESCVVTTMLIF